MFKKWFWNLFLFAFNVFGFIMLAWFVSGLIMNNADTEKKSANSAIEEINKQSNFEYETTPVCISDNCITADIADTKEKKEYGLMFRTRIRNTEGMLFVYEEESDRSFYMKNMYVSIEIIWINSNHQITHMEHAFPCLTQNCIKYVYPAKYVLEVQDGFMEDNNINLGDIVNFKLKESE